MLAPPHEHKYSATNAGISYGSSVGTIFDDEPRISISNVAKYEGKQIAGILVVVNYQNPLLLWGHWSCSDPTWGLTHVNRA